MAGMIETHRSCVRLWECDEMGHLNVTYYMSRFSDAGVYRQRKLVRPPRSLASLARVRRAPCASWSRSIRESLL